MLEKEKAIEKLNEKEIKVYQYILAHSLEFPFMTIRELADKVQVSTTVILNLRFMLTKPIISIPDP